LPLLYTKAACSFSAGDIKNLFLKIKIIKTKINEI